MKINWNDPTHPIYALLRVALYMGSLTLLLMWNASDFDVTEIKTLVPMFLLAAGGEGALQAIRGRTPSS